MIDGKTVRNMQSVIPKQNKFKKLVHLGGFTIEIYYDARSCERQICLHFYIHSVQCVGDVY